MSKRVRNHALTISSVCALAITAAISVPAAAAELPETPNEPASATVATEGPGQDDSPDEATDSTDQATEADPEEEAAQSDEPEQVAVEEVSESESLPSPAASRAAPRAAATQVKKIDPNNRCGIPEGSFAGMSNVKSSGLTRIGGKDRYHTASLIRSLVSSTPAGDERAVFVASGQGFADGLSLGALAAKYGWPLLITPTNSLDKNTSAAVKKINPTHIYIAGGNGAISKSVEKQLKSLSTKSPEVIRFAGKNRFDTSKKIAECFPAGAPAFVTTGQNFADAVVAGPAAAKKGGAVLLTLTNAVHADTKAALKSLSPKNIYVIGGSWSAANQNTLKKSSGAKALQVVSGKNRYATSSKVATTFFSSKPKTVIYAAGSNYPDALSGISVAAMTDAPIVLTQSSCRPKDIEAVSKSASAHVVLGGAGLLGSKSYTTTCAPKPKETKQQQVVSIAKSLNGKSYASGGTGPNAFDCSGFTQYVYKKVGISIPRTTWDQWSAGKKVSSPKAGDIVVMSGGSHVAIYLGNGMIIDAGTPRTGVSIRQMWAPANAYVRFT